MGEYLHLQIFFRSFSLSLSLSLSLRDHIDKTAYWWLTDDSFLLVKSEKYWLLVEAVRLRSQRMLTSVGAGSSSIACVC